MNNLEKQNQELEALKRTGKGRMGDSPDKISTISSGDQKIIITASVPTSRHQHQNSQYASIDLFASGPSEDDYIDLVKKLQATFELKDDGLVKKIVADHFKKKNLVHANDNRGGDLDENTKSDSAKLRKELQAERERYKKLQVDAEQLSKDYDSIAKGHIPNYDDIKKKVLHETVSKERAKYEKERQIILSDLQARVDKVVKLEIELEEEKERNRNLENQMVEGERALKKKVATLENNLEQLTNMYHQLASQKSLWKVDNQVSSVCVCSLMEFE